MATSYHHGITNTEENTGARPTVPFSTSVIGLVATAADADDKVFPLGEPVFFTNIDQAIQAAGTQGTLRDNLDVIKDQVHPRIVIVRVAEGADEDETRKNIIAGIDMLARVPARLSITPRILCAGLLDEDPAIAQALATNAQMLNGFAYANAVGNSVTEVIKYREQFGQRELMLGWPNQMAVDKTTGAIVEKPISTMMAAMRSRIDEEYGWHHPMSNLPVNGVVGLSHDVSWSLTDTSTDADVLNEACITTFASRGGYRLWGLRTCSSEPLFAFETAVRSGQIIREIIADALDWAIDKPMSIQLIRDILATINAELRRVVARGFLVGGQAWYDPEPNTPATLKGGKLVIKYDYTPVPPLEDLTLIQKITDEYLTEYAVQLAQ